MTGAPISLQAWRDREARLVSFIQRLEPLHRRMDEIEAEIVGIVLELRLAGVPGRDIKLLRRAKQLGSESMWQEAVARAMRAGTKRPEVIGKIYFLRCRSTGLLKIGFSENVTARLASIRRQSSTEIDTLLIVDGGETEEAELHQRFASSRHHNEWFTETPSLMAEIERLREAGQADVVPLLSWGVGR